MRPYVAAFRSRFLQMLQYRTAALLNDRGINALATPLVIVLSGNLLPLALLPDTWQAVLVLQPFAGLLDIPVRLYFAEFTGWTCLLYTSPSPRDS